MLKRTKLDAAMGLVIFVVAANANHPTVFAGWRPFESLPDKHVLNSDLPLTEDLAIELTRRTMRKTLKKNETLELRPVGYNEDKTPRFFARNSLNESSGFVRWDKHAEGHKAKHYMVHIEKKGKTFSCSYGQMK